MKKTYQSPQMEIIMLNAKTSMCAASIPVGKEDETGAGQLSQQFWGNTIFDDTDDSIDEEF